MTGNRDEIFRERLAQAFSIPAPDRLRPDRIGAFLEEKKNTGKAQRLRVNRLLPLAAGFVILLGCVIAVQSGVLGFRAGTKANEGMAAYGGGEQWDDAGAAPESAADTGGSSGGGSFYDEQLESAMPDETTIGIGAEASRDGLRFAAFGGTLSVYTQAGEELASAAFGDTTDTSYEIAFFDECAAVFHANAAGDHFVSAYLFDANRLSFLGSEAIAGPPQWISSEDAVLNARFDEAGDEMNFWVEDGVLMTESEETG